MDFQAIFENFRSAVTDHYFDMNGRVGRAQFWYFIAAYIAFSIIAGLLRLVTFLPLREIYFLVMLLPTAGMTARRLQDTGRDGKLVWIFIIAGFVSQICSLIMALSFFALGGFLSFLLFGPSLVLINLALLVACIVLIYFCCQPGDAGDNAYGPPPPVFDPSVRVSSSP